MIGHTAPLPSLRRPGLRVNRSRALRRHLRGPLASALGMRLRRRAFLRATRVAVTPVPVVLPTYPAPVSLPKTGSASAASPSVAATVVATLAALVLLLDPHSPLPWLNALRATSLVAGLVYLGWYLQREERSDRVRLAI